MDPMETIRNKAREDAKTGVNFAKNYKNETDRMVYSRAYLGAREKMGLLGVVSNPLTPDYGSENSVKKFCDTIFPIAREKMEVEYIKGSYYAYGSELACLRLFHKYNLSTHNPKVRIGYSKNLATWYFELEVLF